jgi:hypothetical protein
MAISHAQLLQGMAQVFLALLGANANDEIMGGWLDPDIAPPETGRAAWARDQLGLSAFECERLGDTFPQALDHSRSGIRKGIGIYIVLRGPRGPVKMGLRERDGGFAVTPGEELGSLRGALARLPKWRSEG